MSHPSPRHGHRDGDSAAPDKHHSGPKKQALRSPKYQPLSFSSGQTDAFDGIPPTATTSMTQLQSALSECEPSMLLLLNYGHSMGLHFWQDVADPQRIKFDATQFNQLAGYAPSKGIKGDFLARMKRKIEEHMPVPKSSSASSHPITSSSLLSSPPLIQVGVDGALSSHAFHRSHDSSRGLQRQLDPQTAVEAESLQVQLQLREMMDAESLASSSPSSSSSSSSSSSDEEVADVHIHAGPTTKQAHHPHSSELLICISSNNGSSNPFSSGSVRVDHSGAKEAASVMSRGRPKSRRPKRRRKLSPCERDNWESDSFSALIASGYSVSELIDARVGSTRIVGVQTTLLRKLLPVRESTLYLLHVLVLAAWVEAKFHHATEVREKLLAAKLSNAASATSEDSRSGPGSAGPHQLMHSRQQRANMRSELDPTHALHRTSALGDALQTTTYVQPNPAATAAAAAETRGAVVDTPASGCDNSNSRSSIVHGNIDARFQSLPPSEASAAFAATSTSMSADELPASWAKLQHDLQIKSSVMLAYVLTIGQQMQLAERQWIGAAYNSLDEVLTGPSQMIFTQTSHSRAEKLQLHRYMKLWQDCCATDGVLPQVEAVRRREELLQPQMSQQQQLQPLQQYAIQSRHSSSISVAAVLQAAAAAAEAYSGAVADAPSASAAVSHNCVPPSTSSVQVPHPSRRRIIPTLVL